MAEYRQTDRQTAQHCTLWHFNWIKTSHDACRRSVSFLCQNEAQYSYPAEMTGGHIDWQEHPSRTPEFLVLNTHTDVTGAACNARLSVALNLFHSGCWRTVIFVRLLARQFLGHSCRAGQTYRRHYLSLGDTDGRLLVNIESCVVQRHLGRFCLQLLCTRGEGGVMNLLTS